MGRDKSNINIKYKCLGASKQVTGSCHMLSIYVKDKPYNLIIDFGMIQNGLKTMNELYRENKSLNISWGEISGVAISHAHA